MNGAGQFDFRPMFYPRSMAVVGVSQHPEKLGNYVLRSAIASGLERLYAIHAGGERSILGVPTYRSITEIPDSDIELFLFAIAPDLVLANLEAAAAHGCKAAVVFSSGFKETGEAGYRLEKELSRQAEAMGIRVIGPNTMGFFRADSRINATFVPTFSEYFPPGDGISVISQSGGVLALICNQLIDNYLPLSTMVGLGNRANIEFADLLEYFADDLRTSMVAMFIEGVDEARRLYESAGRCAQVKPVLALGAGYSNGGQKVAHSHTGSMASSGALYATAFHQAGVLQVKDLAELIDTIKVLYMAPRPRGRQVGIITHTAGPSILAADVLEQGGLQLASLNAATQESLRASGALPDFSPTDNPVDLANFGYMERWRYQQVMQHLAADSGVDLYLAIYMSTLEETRTAPFPIPEFANVVKQAGKPAVVVWGAPLTGNEEIHRWTAAGIPAFFTPERAARALVNLVKYYELAERRRKGMPEVSSGLPTPVQEIIAGARDELRGLLLEHEAKKVVELLGIACNPTFLAATPEEAVERAGKIGYPVVLKIASPLAIHKSNLGGVKLNLQDAGQVLAAFQEIMRAAEEKIPAAELKGVTVQSMLPPGREVIIGTTRDRQLGPVVMFGLGGIWVELLEDVAFRLAPLTPDEAVEMIQEVRGYALLAGYRGEAGVDMRALANAIAKLGELMVLAPAISEIDLNPVMAYPMGLAVADARIVIRPEN